MPACSLDRQGFFLVFKSLQQTQINWGQSQKPLQKHFLVCSALQYMYIVNTQCNQIMGFKTQI